jgi:hypothetical protein
MISEPGRYMDQFIDAGLRLDHDPRRDRGADRTDPAQDPEGRAAAGLAVKPGRRCRRWSRTATCSTSSW